MSMKHLEAIARAAALDAANETVTDCLMWLIQHPEQKALPFRIPIRVAESELAAAIADAKLPADKYMACVRVAADEANWVYDCVLKSERDRLASFH
jgi:hypothetical protein